mmetsp:Transcript_3378/g.13744  ORF Transcript_3378/g.13744 Transcript_3378/m.13744 type:complete len:263 (+) Transcript_3378:2080-2868(+)
MPQTLVGLVGLDAIEGQEGHGRDALLLEVLDALLGDGGVLHHDGVGISAQDGDDGEVVLALGHLEKVSHPTVDPREEPAHGDDRLLRAYLSLRLLAIRLGLAKLPTDLLDFVSEVLLLGPRLALLVRQALVLGPGFVELSLGLVAALLQVCHASQLPFLLLVDEVDALGELVPLGLQALAHVLVSLGRGGETVALLSQLERFGARLLLLPVVVLNLRGAQLLLVALLELRLEVVLEDLLRGGDVLEVLLQPGDVSRALLGVG